MLNSKDYMQSSLRDTEIENQTKEQDYIYIRYLLCKKLFGRFYNKRPTLED